jgi:hypothetical protein
MLGQLRDLVYSQIFIVVTTYHLRLLFVKQMYSSCARDMERAGELPGMLISEVMDMHNHGTRRVVHPIVAPLALLLILPALVFLAAATLRLLQPVQIQISYPRIYMACHTERIKS